MVLPFLVGLIGLLVWEEIPTTYFLLFLAAGVAALLGLLDDLKNLSISIRLFVHIAMATWLVYWAGDLPAIELAAMEISYSLPIKLLIVIGIVWFLNLFNFMDGIDGLAASEALFVTVLSFVLVMNTDDQATPLIASLLGAVVLGFLCWNSIRAPSI